MLMLKNNPIFFIYVYKSCNFLWADNLMMSLPVYIGLFHIYRSWSWNAEVVQYNIEALILVCRHLLFFSPVNDLFQNKKEAVLTEN